MKKLEAIIKHSKFDQAKESLMQMGVKGITVTEVKEFGTGTRHREIYRGTEFTVDSAQEMKIEITVRDEELDAAAAILSGSLAIGGDVLVVPVTAV